MSSKYNYISITSVQQIPVVTIQDIESFLNFANELAIKTLFVSKQEPTPTTEQTGSLSEDIMNRTRQLATTFGVVNEATETQLHFIHNGINYCVDAAGFETVEAYNEAKTLGFENGDDFKASKSLAFNNADDYNAFVNAGFDDKTVFEQAKELGYIGSFKQINASTELNDEAKASLKTFKNDADLFKAAKQRNYENFEQYFAAVKLGFAQNDAADFKLAKANGFTSAKQYYNARNRGFETAEESTEAEALKLDDKFELNLFKQLNKTKDELNFPFHDQAHIYILINELAAESATELNKIEDMFQAEQDKLSTKSTATFSKGAEWISNSINKFLKPNALPNWYKTGFKTKEEIRTFLISNQNVIKLGKLDITNNIFNRN